jgi:inorganic pyrophosphatase
VKNQLHKATGLLLADRVLYSAVHYPANYGFIPHSYSTDGDPLDVLLLSHVPLAPLSIARCRAIGAMRMSDEHGEDDKIIAVHIDDPQYAHFRDVS